MPDPAYKFETPRSTHRRLNGWFRGIRVKREAWDRTYSRLPRDAAGRRAVVVRAGGSREQEGGVPPRVVDIGCGRGVDDLWFARQGAPVLGLDYALRGSDAGRRGWPAAEDVDLEFRGMNLLRAALGAGRGRPGRPAAGAHRGDRPPRRRRHRPGRPRPPVAGLRDDAARRRAAVRRVPASARRERRRVRAREQHLHRWPVRRGRGELEARGGAVLVPSRSAREHEQARTGRRGTGSDGLVVEWQR